MKRFITIIISAIVLAACSQGQDKAFEGVFTHKGGNEVVELKSDGSCILRQDGSEYRGTYEKQDNNLNLSMGITMGMKFSIQDQDLVDEKGQHWQRK